LPKNKSSKIGCKLVKARLFGIAKTKNLDIIAVNLSEAVFLRLSAA
jgi:hypothetical protein